VPLYRSPLGASPNYFDLLGALAHPF